MQVFQNAVAEATGCDPNAVVVKESHPVAVAPCFLALHEVSSFPSASCCLLDSCLNSFLH